MILLFKFFIERFQFRSVEVINLVKSLNASTEELQIVGCTETFCSFFENFFGRLNLECCSNNLDRLTSDSVAKSRKWLLFLERGKLDMIMKSPCQKSTEVFPTSSEVEELYVTYIVNCVFIGVLSYTTVMFNIVTILAIRKISLLSKPLKTLLLSLAFSDTCVGLLVEPFYISILVKWSQFNNPSCVTYLAFLNLTNLFLLASFCGVVAISVERFLAIYLHLRYEELVSDKRVIAVVISIWLFCALTSSASIWRSSAVSSLLFVSIGVLCLLITTVVYIKIYAVIRRHRNQIQTLQQTTTRNNDKMSLSSAKKSATGLFYVYLLLLICYVPRGVYFFTKKLSGFNTTSKSFAVYSLTLLFFNSFLNPVIYCWKMRCIRQAIMDTLRNIFRWRRNSNSFPSHPEESMTKVSC